MKELLDFRAARLSQSPEDSRRIGDRLRQDLSHSLMGRILSKGGTAVGDELVRVEHSDLLSQGQIEPTTDRQSPERVTKRTTQSEQSIPLYPRKRKSAPISKTSARANSGSTWPSTASCADVMSLPSRWTMSHRGDTPSIGRRFGRRRLGILSNSSRRTKLVKRSTTI